MAGLSDFAAGVGSSAVGAYAGYMMQDSLMDKSNEQYKENATIAYNRQRRMSEDATPLAVLGMREAGLNPASMSQPMSPASVPSVPHGSTPQAPSVDVASSALAAAQIDNIQAQTRKTEVETQNMEDENATVDVNLRRHFQGLLDDPNITEDDKKFYQSIIDHAPSYSVGSLKGLDSYFSLSQHATDVAFNEFDKQYKKAVLDANFEHDVPDWLARLPKEQYNEVVQKIGNIQANTLLLASETALNSDKADELRAQIQKDYVEMKHIYHEDWASMMENKDYWALFMGLTEKILPATVQAVVLGKTFKGGARTLGVPSLAPKGAPKTPLQKQADIKAGNVKLDPTARTLQSLTKSWGEKRANEMFKQYLGTPNRKGLTFHDWLRRKGIGRF